MGFTTAIIHGTSTHIIRFKYSLKLSLSNFSLYNFITMSLVELYNYIRDIYIYKYAQYMLEVDLQNSINLCCQLDLLDSNDKQELTNSKIK